MTDNLQLNDPVHVERGDSQQLEGVVAFLGKVQFAEGDDWVGVRLTGTSVGLGKNDGSVKGVSYFSCGPNGGVFVRKSHVSRRELSKLEALRLKRELAKKSAGITSPKPTTAPPGSSTSRTPATRTPTTTSSRSPTRAAASATVTTTESSIASVALSPSKQARIEEIRARRAALAEKHTTSLSPTSSQAPSRSASPSPEKLDNKEQIEALQKQVQNLSSKLRSEEEENASLQQSLSKAEQHIHESNKAREKAEQQPPKEVAVTVEDDRADLESELQKTKDDCRDMEERLQEALANVEKHKRDLERERTERESEVQQLIQVRSELSALRHEFQAMSDQSSNRSASDASHYKERAKLQAELGAAKRQVEELEREKIEMESVLEELALDKEQLQEEKEVLQDRMEELKVDAETAQMEVEELKTELEIAKEAAEGAPVMAGGSGEGGVTGADAEDVARGLSVQNARLREALIRLREQSSFEKMELSRQLRTAEKDATNVATLTEEVETLRETKKKLDEEIRDLKEMVDQGSAFESMVETLSDRVLLLEDDNTALQSTIREMEEAADITAEMEEVQAEENKTLMRDLEGHDSIIRNLEEAIKMQRRREEDFQRTVSNYRKSVETLKQEKKALMAFQEGDEEEKGDLLATSRKALARAAQLVADASIARKREAEAVFDRIDGAVQHHLSERLESLLPGNVASSEIASIKGELLLSRVVGKASKALEGMASVFTESIRSGMDKASSEVDENLTVDAGATFQLTDESMQCITNMIHQGDVAIATIGVSSDLLKLLSAGQWPDLLSPEASSELGAIVGNSIAELDVVLGDQLRLLKEEGILSPHTSNIGAFQQTVQTTMQSLQTTLEVDGSPLVSQDWSPPGWSMLKDVSISKFSCMSSGGVVASIVSPDDGTHTTTSTPVDPQVVAVVQPLMMKLDQISVEATKACHRLVSLDLQGDSTVTELSELSTLWKEASLALLKTTQETFSGKADFTRDDLVKCESAAEKGLRELARFSSALRAANLNVDNDERFHPLSPEAKDAWEGISSLARAMRSVDGDSDDVNYLLRARALEHQLMEGVENGPKLSLASAKISSLEKVGIYLFLCTVAFCFWTHIILSGCLQSLSTRSKEIALQNARISELEKVLAKSNSAPSPMNIKSSEMSSSEEINTLKEENRVVSTFLYGMICTSRSLTQISSFDSLCYSLQKRWMCCIDKLMSTRMRFGCSKTSSHPNRRKDARICRREPVRSCRPAIRQISVVLQR